MLDWGGITTSSAERLVGSPIVLSLASLDSDGFSLSRLLSVGFNSL